jgi:acyl carrier protein
MTNLEKYNKAFVETFGITEDSIYNLSYQSIVSWDSVGHMQLMAIIEGTFDIMLDTDDIIAFSSYREGIMILKKYHVEI